MTTWSMAAAPVSSAQVGTWSPFVFRDPVSLLPDFMSVIVRNMLSKAAHEPVINVLSMLADFLLEKSSRCLSWLSDNI